MNTNNPHFHKNRSTDKLCPRCGGRVIKAIRRCIKCSGALVWIGDEKLIHDLLQRKDAWYRWDGQGWVYQDYYLKGYNKSKYTSLMNSRPNTG